VSTLLVELLCFDSSPSLINHTWLVLSLPLLDLVVYKLPVRASTVFGESPISEFLLILSFSDIVSVQVILRS
jgi:hypothetical protein